jgi:ZIP family zinc transporter
MNLFTAILYGVGTGLPLVVGAIVGIVLRPPQRFTAVALAFASGSLITGLSFELFEPAFQTAGLGLTTAGLLVGTGFYIGVKYVVSIRTDAEGVPLLAAVILDGLAENITLGVALVGNSLVGGPLALFAGIAANNFPEAVGGASEMTAGGRSAKWTLGLWTVTATGLVFGVVFGYSLLSGTGATALALVRATGGGAVLASLAVEIMPDAYEGGGPLVAFATAMGLVLTFALI